MYYERSVIKMLENFKKCFGCVMGVMAGLIVTNEILTLYNKRAKETNKEATKSDSKEGEA